MNEGENSGKPLPATRLAHERAREILHKNKTGTWLSPLSQPQVQLDHPIEAIPVPLDPQHRRYIAGLATSLPIILSENAEHFREPLDQSFQAYPLEARAAGDSSRKTRSLTRSQTNAPVQIPFPIAPNTVVANCSKDRSAIQLTGSLRYAWQEEVTLVQTNSQCTDKRIFTIQVRHHTRLEPYHETRRPVFCINLKSNDLDFIDLRLITMLNVEGEFLEMATHAFRKEFDYAGGSPVRDTLGRIWIDERLIRRAAFQYMQHQRSLSSETLYQDDTSVTPEIRFAHFLIHRSHQPELQYDAKARRFTTAILDDESAVRAS
jgi:hypothetical protein